MSDSKEYIRELTQARKNLIDSRERGAVAIGGDALELMKSALTSEEIAISDLRVAVMIELVKARKEHGITQTQLEKMSGVRQPVIARMERGTTVPQLDTVLRVLAPLGKTLAVVPLE